MSAWRLDLVLLTFPGNQALDIAAPQKACRASRNPLAENLTKPISGLSLSLPLR